MKILRWVFWSRARRNMVVGGAAAGLTAFAAIMFLAPSGGPGPGATPTVTVTVDDPTGLGLGGVPDIPGIPSPSPTEASPSVNAAPATPAVPTTAAVTRQAQGFLTAWLSGRTTPDLDTWRAALTPWTTVGTATVIALSDTATIPAATVSNMTVAVSDPTDAYVTAVLTDGTILTVTMNLTSGVWLASDITRG